MTEVLGSVNNCDAGEFLEDCRINRQGEPADGFECFTERKLGKLVVNKNEFKSNIEVC